MRVLFLLDSLSPGGTETSTVQLAGALRQLGVDAAVAVLRTREHDLGPVAAARNVPVLRLRSTRFLSDVRALHRLLRSTRPDVLHTALFTSDQVGRLASIGSPVKVVSSFVSTPYDPIRLADPDLTLWKIRAVQAADAVTGRLLVDRFHSVSTGTAEANAAALRLPLDRVSVVERGRDMAHLDPVTPDRRRTARAELGLDPTQPVLLSLGRHDPQKAHVDLVQAVARLGERYPDLVVLLAGKEGSATDRLTAAIAGSRAAPHIRLLGHRTDAARLLAASDALVISSHFEGTAGVALEAMAVGVPVVSTDIAGLRGILEDRVNAVLARPADPVSLAGSIQTVLDDHDLAATLVANGLADFADRFTLERAAERMREFYVALTSG